MATQKTNSPSENVSEMQAAAALILQREEIRRQRTRDRTRQRRRERRREERKSVRKMHRSIEVIKWCIVAVCTVWIISFVVSIGVLIAVQGRVAEIEGQVQRIRQAMDNPFATAGARLGGQVDEKLKEFLGLPDPQDQQE